MKNSIKFLHLNKFSYFTQILTDIKINNIYNQILYEIKLATIFIANFVKNVRVLMKITIVKYVV